MHLFTNLLTHMLIHDAYPIRSIPHDECRTYIPFFLSILQALTVWCVDETPRVEAALYQDSTIAALLQLFAAANTQSSLTPLLHAFNRLLTASTKLNHALVTKGLITRLVDKLRQSQMPAETRIDLLVCAQTRTICETLLVQF